MSLEVKCKQCGKQFTINNYRLNKNGNYCSRKCFGESQRKGEYKICQNCGRKIFVPNYLLKLGRGKYCNWDCYKKYKDDHSIKGEYRVCLVCGKKFWATPKNVRQNKRFCSRKCSSKPYKQIEVTCKYCGKKFFAWPSTNRTYCSKECKDKHQGEHVKGENHPLWKGGISFEPYCPAFNNEFKERVREFWNHKCGICGKTEKENNQKLIVHHVNYEKMVCCNNTPPLFIDTCRSCHGKTNFNRKYWEEMLTNYIMIWFNGESYTPKN